MSQKRAGMGKDLVKASNRVRKPGQSKHRGGWTPKGTKSVPTVFRSELPHKPMADPDTSAIDMGPDKASDLIATVDEMSAEILKNVVPGQGNPILAMPDEIQAEIEAEANATRFP
jgi:hypothetical protein